jgi:hypothetical protein
MRLSKTAHTSRPWRTHEIAPDFRLEDVWALPGRGGPDDLPRLIELIASFDPSKGSSSVARVLWAIRWKLGELLGWDDPLSGLGSRVPTLRDPLPPTYAKPRSRSSIRFPSARSTSPTTKSPRRSLTRPCTALCTSAQTAVLVKPNGPFVTAYMAAIRRFRHLIVYPALMRQGGSCGSAPGRHRRPAPSSPREPALAVAMDRDTAIDLLDRLHHAQNEFYAGGSGAALEQLLAPASPGRSPATIR